jgi:hypothetical protein
MVSTTERRGSFDSSGGLTFEPDTAGKDRSYELQATCCARLLGLRFFLPRLFGFLLLALVVVRICVLGLLLFYPWPGFR